MASPAPAWTMSEHLAHELTFTTELLWVPHTSAATPPIYPPVTSCARLSLCSTRRPHTPSPLLVCTGVLGLYL